MGQAITPPKKKGHNIMATNTKYENDFIASVFDAADSAKQSEGKILKTALDLAALLRNNQTNIMSQDDLISFAKGEKEKGFLTEYLTANSNEFRNKTEQRKDKANGAAREDAKRTINNVLNITKQVFMIAANIIVSEIEYKYIPSKGVIAYNNEEGVQVSLNTKNAFTQSKKVFGREKTQVPHHKEGAKELNLNTVLDYLTSQISGKTEKDFSEEQIEGLLLLKAELVDILENTQDKLAA